MSGDLSKESTYGEGDRRIVSNDSRTEWWVCSYEYIDDSDTLHLVKQQGPFAWEEDAQDWIDADEYDGGVSGGGPWVDKLGEW